jgi:hypothetical protein
VASFCFLVRDQVELAFAGGCGFSTFVGFMRDENSGLYGFGIASALASGMIANAGGGDRPLDRRKRSCRRRVACRCTSRWGVVLGVRVTHDQV